MQSLPQEVNVTLKDATFKQEIALEIENAVKVNGLLYLEAATAWLEENGYTELQYNRYLPPSIIEKIKIEAIQEQLIPPSMAEPFNQTSSLEFLL